MSIFRIVLILDDTVAAQVTLLGQIQNALASIAANTVPAPLSQNSIEVRKIA